MLSSSPESNFWKCQQGPSFYWRLLAGVTGLCIFLSYALYIGQGLWLGSASSIALPQRSDQSKSRSTSGPGSVLAAGSPSFRVSEISKHFQQTRFDCSAIFAGEKAETDRALAIADILAEHENPGEKRPPRPTTSGNRKLVSKVKAEVKVWSREFVKLTDQWYTEATKDCDSFKRSRGYITSPLTQEEEEFPIAYSLLVFKDIEMVERVFRSVFRPQNRYCIHVDSKSDPVFYSTVQSLAACFPDNVRMSSRRVDVRWGTYTVLEPELICMQDLWDMDDKKASDIKTHREAAERKRAKWKYFINLTGQEFPLKTNYELVEILKAYRGANNEEGTRKRANKDRWKTQAPHGIKPAKGGVHTLFNRATIDFILHNQTAKDFIAWLRTTRVPDETMFATINYNPHLRIPGTYTGNQMEKVISYNRYKQWYGYNCSSRQTVRSICILSTGDLPKLGKTPYLFANKFYLHQDRVAIGCLEEKLFNDTRDEYLGTKKFDTSFYEEQDFVRHQVPAG